MLSEVRVKRRPTSKSKQSFSRTVSARSLPKGNEYACATTYQSLEIRCTLFAPAPKLAAEDFVNEHLIPNLDLNLAPLELEVQIWDLGKNKTRVQTFNIVADSSARARRSSRKQSNTYDRRLVGVLPKS